MEKKKRVIIAYSHVNRTKEKQGGERMDAYRGTQWIIQLFYCKRAR